MNTQRILNACLFTFLSLILFSCDKDENTENSVGISELIGCWTHSMEEDITGLTNEESRQIYRPCDYKEFEASRYRAVYDLAEDGLCEYLALAANDAHFMTDGLWEYDDTDQLLIIRQMDNTLVAQYRVFRAENDRLILQQ